MANSSLVLSSLDFDTQKQNFINYLSSQSVFRDYDFEGSNINTLIDVMTYNTYLNAFYLNMIGSEMHLDSAQKMDSVISRAKELNYLPRSNRSSKAVISFTIETTGVTNPMVISKGTVFSGVNSNNSFTFVTDSATSYLSTNTTYSVSNLEIYEGSYVQESYIVDYNIEDQRFILSNPTIDTNSIEIIVQENNANSIYTFASDLFGLSSNSEVYFLQGFESGTYEIVFGDNVFGKNPKSGAVIYANYRITSGSDGNGISAFNLDSDIGDDNGGYAVPNTIEVITPAISGANAEGINSIKFNAPRHFQTQGRCVTQNDYITTILQNFPEVKYVNVFGGEVSNASVEFGTVYIASSTYSGTPLTDNRKKDVESFIDGLTSIGIRTKVIDPEYLSLQLGSTIHVNFNNTASTSTTITSKAIEAVKTYNSNNLQNFNTAFRMSKLEQSINESDDGILSNETTVQMYKSFTPPTTLTFAITCNFENAIESGTIVSSEYVTGGKTYVLTDYIEGIDAGSGKIYQVERSTNLASSSYTEVGTVDYVSGLINIIPLIFFSIGAGLKIYATPVNKDVYCRKNTIIAIDTVAGLNFNVVSN